MRLAVCVGVVAAGAACGKRGAPLPPLVRVPAPPVDFTAERRGDDVTIHFTVPAANTDGSRPANIERVDVYRFTGPPVTNDDQLLKVGTRVASLGVKAPRDPEATTEADEPAEEPDLKEEGLDQGAIAEFEDQLDESARTPVNVSTAKDKARARRQTAGADTPRPLLGPPPAVAATFYFAVGINPRGRRGPLTRRVAVPLGSTPRAPAPPAVEYDETTIHVSWTRPASDGEDAGPGASGGLLPSRTLGVPATSISYHVYDLSPSQSAGRGEGATPSIPGQARLTRAPVTETKFDDTRMAWGTTRCYAIRTVEAVGGLALESEASPPTCTTLTDTFAPAAPRDLRAVATERAITLIWEPNSERDLLGYIVLRAPGGSDKFERLMPDPIQPSSFDDKATSGAHLVYAVQAVDRAGNVSPMSNRADETAR